MTGLLYICPTPIGNLEDMTLRAIRILKEVDYIACEDTRVTQKLLNHYEIKTRLVSYHKFSERQKSDSLINDIKEGKNIALVSDAGTPVISDPGSILVEKAHENNIKVVPLPGASAVITALSASCIDNFVFIGFLPRKTSEKEEILSKYSRDNVVFYESPSRLVSSLEDVKNILGKRTVTIYRELTKIYEEINRDEIQKLIEHYTNKKPKGEIVVLIEKSKEKETISNIDLMEKVNKLKKEGYKSKDISKILSVLTSESKNNIYKLLNE